MDDKADHIRRRQNLISISLALKERASSHSEFGSSEELEEIGLLAIRIAMLEEHMAHHCEVLLLRPELRGFSSARPVLTRGLSEKLDLYKSLVITIGTLHSLDTEGIESSIRAIRDIGEARHTVIHGYLSRRANDQTLAGCGKSRSVGQFRLLAMFSWS